jgi:uncharacterized membrane protein
MKVEFDKQTLLEALELVQQLHQLQKPDLTPKLKTKDNE